MIPYGHQTIDDDDVAAVLGVLRGDWLTQGPHVEEFEDSLASYVGADHAVAFANGTAALHAACAAGGLGSGDVVATSALSFVASANCARYVGANPIFVDVDPETFNLDPERVPRQATGLVAVHYAGLPLDLTRLTHRPRVVIEDAAHALGAATPSGPVGSCAASDMCVFSFHPVKTITTAEGGAVTTNSRRIADALRRFRNHGIERCPEVGGWYYEIRETGFNYRLTDIQAALGTSQLRKCDAFVARRTALADQYARLLPLVVRRPPDAPPGYRHSHHIYPVRVPDRGHVYDALRREDIGVQVHYVPIYRHPVFRDLGVGPDDFPVTEAVYRDVLSLPLYPSLSDGEQAEVVDTLSRALEP